MDAALELLEEHGLVADEDSLRIGEFDKAKLFRLHERLYSQLFAQQNAVPDRSAADDPFSFLASASLRAQTTCKNYPCRLAKFDFLGRYAALYANNVMFPLPLSPPSKLRSVAKAKDELHYSALALLRLRPLVDAGVITPVVMTTRHCSHTMKWTRKMVEIVHEVSKAEAREWQKQFRVVYQAAEKSSHGRPTLFIEGPEDFLEHGSHVLLVSDANVWRPKNKKLDRAGKVELRGRPKVALVEWIFNQIANDTTFYLSYGRSHDARYLTDRAGEKFLLDMLTADDELAATSLAMNEHLTHALPLLGDLPVATLLRIRSDERESFVRYRSALARLLGKVATTDKRVAPREVVAIFKDDIQPQLLQMKSELYQEQRRQRRRVLGGLGALAATVALGAFGGVVPLLVKGALVAAGSMVGGRLLSKAAEARCEHGADLQEKNDFYFLLRLTEEAESS
jgi:hypothetical protein